LKNCDRRGKAAAYLSNKLIIFRLGAVVAGESNCTNNVHHCAAHRLKRRPNHSDHAPSPVGTIVDSPGARRAVAHGIGVAKTARQDTTMQAPHNPNERPEDRPT
jgi:hypothetical protein